MRRSWIRIRIDIFCLGSGPDLTNADPKDCLWERILAGAFFLGGGDIKHVPGPNPKCFGCYFPDLLSNFVSESGIGSDPKRLIFPTENFGLYGSI
jgi:hypothetical protein